MGTHTKVGLAGTVRLYIDITLRVWFLRFSPNSIIFPPFVSALFPFYTSISFPFFTYVSVSPRLGSYSSYQSIRQSGWKKLDSMVWVWVCQALGSALRCWQLSPLCCSCTEFVIFFRHFCEMLDVRSSSATSLGLQGAFIERPQQQGLSDWALGPLTPSGLGLQISGPTDTLSLFLTFI